MASLRNDMATTLAVTRVPGVESWSFGSMFSCMQEPGETAVMAVHNYPIPTLTCAAIGP